MRNGQCCKCKLLEEDQLWDIVNIAKKPEWTIKMMEANQDPYNLDQKGLIEHLECSEVVDNIQKDGKPKKS